MGRDSIVIDGQAVDVVIDTPLEPMREEIHVLLINQPDPRRNGVYALRRVLPPAAQEDLWDWEDEDYPCQCDTKGTKYCDIHGQTDCTCEPDGSGQCPMHGSTPNP